MQSPPDYYNFERAELFPFIDLNMEKVLDVGCAKGTFGANLKAKGVKEVWGIEPEKKIAEEARLKLDHVFTGMIEEFSTSHNQTFDAIFFNDVLEHMYDPESALNTAKKHLNDNGKIYASIPNFIHVNNLYEILSTRDIEYQDSGILDRTHVRFFTKKSIRRLFEKTGYKVESIDGINPNYGQVFRYINFLLLKRFDEMKFIQFYVRAKHLH